METKCYARYYTQLTNHETDTRRGNGSPKTKFLDVIKKSEKGSTIGQVTINDAWRGDKIFQNAKTSTPTSPSPKYSSKQKEKILNAITKWQKILKHINAWLFANYSFIR